MTCLLLLMLYWVQGVDVESLSSRALELAQERRFEEAEQLWKRAIQISPKLYSATYNLGYMYHSQRQYAKAEPYLMQAVAIRPNEFAPRYLLGMLLSQSGRSQEALEQWRAALGLRPNDLKLMQVMIVEYGKGRFFEEAAGLAERALAAGPAHPALYLAIIKAYQDKNDHRTALRIAGQMIQKFPNVARANFEYAYELDRAGRSDEALAFLKAAINADPNYEEPFFLHGEILSRASRWEEAIPAFRRAIELKHDYTAARVALGRALMNIGRYNEAESELLRAVSIVPDHPQPHLLLSQVYFRCGKEDLAAREKELSMRLRRNKPELMEAPQGRPFSR